MVVALILDASLRCSQPTGSTGLSAAVSVDACLSLCDADDLQTGPGRWSWNSGLRLRTESGERTDERMNESKIVHKRKMTTAQAPAG